MSKKSRALDLFQQAYEIQGDLVSAISLYKQSIAMESTAEAHTFLGWTYSFQDRYKEAIRECQKAIRTDPELGNPYNDIGVYMIEEGRYDEAIPYLIRALRAKRYEALHNPHSNLGRALEKQGLWNEALSEYRAALKLQSNYKLAERSFYRLIAQFN